MKALFAVAVMAGLGMGAASAAEPQVLSDGEMDLVTAQGAGSGITLPYTDLSSVRFPRPAPFPVLDVSGVGIVPPPLTPFGPEG